MKKIKIVADSSSDVLALEGVEFSSTPLKVITDEREFVDDASLNVDEMVDYLDAYKGKIKSSCPNVNDWLHAFGDADEIFCVAITSALSGSYNSASMAKAMYEEENPDKKVYVLDSLSAGAELRLMIDKLSEYIKAGLEFSEICEKIEEYRKTTGLLFMLKSLKNFANNGRVSPILAKIVGLLGICIVGRASDEGTLEPVDKVRGETRSLNKIIENMKKNRFFKWQSIHFALQKFSGSEHSF